MVRTYRSTLSNHRNGKNYAPYNSYSPRSFLKAVESVKNGTMKIFEAAQAYNIPKSTLYRIIQKPAPDGELRLKPGHPYKFSPTIEKVFISYINTVAEWGFPFDQMDLRCLAKFYLERREVQTPGSKKTEIDLPSPDWAASFLLRHRAEISSRLASNISRKRAAVSKEMIEEFFENITPDLQGIPPENIINYDETCLTDNPGAKKFIFKRGSKYPERIVNSNPKSSISLMYSGTAAGHIFPPYVVYKSSKMWSTWTVGGPPGTRYNHSYSGWFDTECFSDWFKTIIIPYCRRREGVKVIIGDNLSSHFNDEVLALCEANNIRFKCLTPNATHILQPLDVAFFAPMKKYWRTIIQDWKKKEGRYIPALTKEYFPRLLSKLHLKLEIDRHGSENIIAGFEKCGLYPINIAKPLKRLPKNQTIDDDEDRASDIVSEGVINMLSEMRGEGQTPPVRGRRRLINVAAGGSVTNLNEIGNDDDPDDPQPCSIVNEEIVVEPPPKKKRGRPAKNLVPVEPAASNANIPKHKIPIKNISSANLNSVQPSSSNANVPKRNIIIKKKSGVNLDPAQPGPSNEIIPKNKSSIKKKIVADSKISQVQPENSNSIDSMEIGDWVLVKFDVQGSTHKMCYIGQIRQVKNGRFWARFLRSYYTKNFCGFIYTYPKIEDLSSFTFKQIVKKVPEPETYQREGLFKFEIHNQSLKCDK